MRRIHIRQATGDPTLALPIVDERGAFVLAAGKPLTSSLANRLWERGFRHTYTVMPGFEGVSVSEPLQPRTYSLARRLLKEMIDAVRQTRPGEVPELPIQSLNDLVAEMCDELEALSNRTPFLLYPPWEGRQDAWIAYALNAAVLAGLLGLKEGTQQARRLVTAALVQDLGLWRSDRPNDHVNATTDLLRPVQGLGAVVKAIAAQHHELLDGSGYPDGKTKDNLHELAPFMHVVVAYLDMISSATKGVLPHEALEGLLAGADVLYDRDVVNQFHHIVPTYPPGTVVRLSNGRRGVVLEPGPQGLHRPKVRLLPQSIGRVGAVASDDVAEEPSEYLEIDLAAEFSVLIERVLN